MKPQPERPPVNIDYAFSKRDADYLKGVIGLPAKFRLLTLRLYEADHGHDALMNLFVQFIGMANSVSANAREWLGLAAIIHGDMDSYAVEKLNTPTLFGALNGATLARKARGMCQGCAFRAGTAANQSHCTTIDAADTVSGELAAYSFMCHEHLDDAGEPTRECRGFLAAKKDCAALVGYTPEEEKERG